MPHKFNADRRDKFPKAKYAVINRPEYNDALRARGDLTVWFDNGAAGKWRAPRRKTRGGQPKGSVADFRIDESALATGHTYAARAANCSNGVAPSASN